MKLNKIVFILLMIIFWPAGLLATENMNTQALKIRDLLTNIRANYQDIHSFTALMVLENFEPNYKLQRQKVWFKKPNYIKLEQLGPFKKGAVIVVKPNGTIKGHLGGFLSFAVVSLAPDDPNLLSVTDDSVFVIDYDEVLDIAFKLAKKSKRYFISEEKVKHQKRIILDSYYDEVIDHYRLIIDPNLQLIVGLERYSKDKLIHRIEWKDVRLNVPLNEEDFDL